MRGFPPYPQSSGDGSAAPHREMLRAVFEFPLRFGKNERPVRGDNRTGQAIWALGVDGRSRRIRPRWGGITAPTHIGRGRAALRSNASAIFLAFRQRSLD